MSPQRPSRRAVLTQEIRQRVVAALRAGAYLQTAAAHAGISRATLGRWLRDGAKAKRGKYRDFALEVEKALADAELSDLATIRQAAQGAHTVKTKKVVKKGDTVEQTETTQTPHWGAAAWRLERRYPDRYGRRHEDPDKPGAKPRKKRIVTGFNPPKESGKQPGPDKP